MREEMFEWEWRKRENCVEKTTCKTGYNEIKQSCGVNDEIFSPTKKTNQNRFNIHKHSEHLFATSLFLIKWWWMWIVDCVGRWTREKQQSMRFVKSTMGKMAVQRSGLCHIPISKHTTLEPFPKWWEIVISLLNAFLLFNKQNKFLVDYNILRSSLREKKFNVFCCCFFFSLSHSDRVGGWKTLEFVKRNKA